VRGVGFRGGGGVVRRDERTPYAAGGRGRAAGRGRLGGGGGWYQTALTSSHTIVYTIVLVG